MINLFGLQLNIPGVSMIQFIATIAILLMVIFFYGLYLIIYVWKFGEPMRKYLKARLSPNTGIIQIYEHEGVDLHLAHTNNGEFTDLENKGFAQVDKVKWFWFLKKDKITFLKPKPIVSKSTVSINGVESLLAWNVNPKLPDRYISTLEALIDLGYNSYQDVIDRLSDGSIDRTSVVNGMTIEEFLVLHEKVRNRNSITVTADDVLNFETKYLDEHPRKSIVEKIVSKEQQRIVDKKYQTYAFGIIALMVIGGFIMLAWKLHNAGAKP